MKKASKYKELTNNKSLFYTLQYERNHPIIMGHIEDGIESAVEKGLYIISIELHSLTEYDIKMILKVLTYYGFTATYSLIDTSTESVKNVLINIEWI
jgi:hypothetical protein